MRLIDRSRAVSLVAWTELLRRRRARPEGRHHGGGRGRDVPQPLLQGGRELERGDETLAAQLKAFYEDEQDHLRFVDEKLAATA
jgi:hypothetical protein